MAINFSYPYPTVGNNNDNLQYVKAVVPVGYATVVNIFTTAQNQGKFFCTKVIFHDPNGATGVGSVTLAIGSASSAPATTAISPVIELTALTGSVANQFVSFDPGLVVFGGATTQPEAAALSLAPGDIMQVNVVSAAGTTTATVLMDVVGYYL